MQGSAKKYDYIKEIRYLKCDLEKQYLEYHIEIIAPMKPYRLYYTLIRTNGKVVLFTVLWGVRPLAVALAVLERPTDRKRYQKEAYRPKRRRLIASNDGWRGIHTKEKDDRSRKLLKIPHGRQLSSVLDQ